MFKKRKEIHPSGQIPEINQSSLHTQHSTYTKREALLIGIQRQKSQRADNPATHKRLLKKNKTKIKKKPSYWRLPFITKVCKQSHKNEAQACGSFSGHESIAKILSMEFMPGPLPLPLGQKGKDGGGNREGIHLRGDTRTPLGLGMRWCVLS